MPAANASSAPSLGSFECDPGPARFFQLRDGNATDGYTHLYLASVTSPASSSPVYYDWQLVHTFTGPDLPVAIAAKSIKKSTNVDNPGWVSYLYYSDSGDDLHQIRFAPNETNNPWRDDTLTTTHAFGFKALAWNGRLWGVKGTAGDLYAVSGLSSGGDSEWDAPSGASLVKSGFGFPKSFYGVNSGDYEIGFAESTGELKYGKSGSTFTKTTVAPDYWNAGRTVDVGGGLLFRFLGGSTNELRRYTIGDVDGLSTGIAAKGSNTDGLLQSNVVSTDTPTTTVSSLCRLKEATGTSSDDQTRAAMIVRAKNWFDLNVPYDHLGDGWRQDGYRRDCSGFVSMVWQLAPPGTTTTGLASSSYTYPITWDALKPGDILIRTNPGHVIIFEKWVNSTTKKSYWYYEESNPGDDMNHAVAPYGQGSDTAYGTYYPRRSNAL